MQWSELLTAALVQAITEFLPLSSSAHLVIVHHLWGVAEPTLFVDVMLHLGTTVAVLIACRGTLWKWWRELPRMGWLVALALVPTAVLGLRLHQATALSTLEPRRVGAELLITSAWLIAGHWLSRGRAGDAGHQTSGIRDQMAGVAWWQALLIGTAQGVSVLPGISRSAATISTALAIGVSPAMAVPFSLIISVPAVLGAMGLEMARAGWHLPQQLSLLQIVAAFLITCGVGWAAIGWLTRLTVHRRLLPFAWYCGLLGLWLMGGRLS